MEETGFLGTQGSPWPLNLRVSWPQTCLVSGLPTSTAQIGILCRDLLWE